ncbi:MAG: hypothetical protein WCK78_06235 [Paludibacter sp.]
MKKKIAILSLVAMFLSVTAFAQTQAPAKVEKAKTEMKCDKKDAGKACCKDKKEGEKCCKETGKACDKKAETKKAADKK